MNYLLSSRELPPTHHRRRRSSHEINVHLQLPKRRRYHPHYPLLRVIRLTRLLQVFLNLKLSEVFHILYKGYSMRYHAGRDYKAMTMYLEVEITQVGETEAITVVIGTKMRIITESNSQDLLILYRVQVMYLLFFQSAEIAVLK